MKALRTRDEFIESLDHEFSWRLKEIADIKSVIQSTELTMQRTFLRAGVPILYAHWEGFVKTASESLLKFLNGQRLNHRQLKSCYIVSAAKKMLHDMEESGNPGDHIVIVDFFMDKMDSRAKLSIEGSIKTHSNLTSTNFERIAKSLGIAIDNYETKYPFINESLVERRNKIAHGEQLDIDAKIFNELVDEVVGLLRLYKNDLQNIVIQNSYRRS
jgi:MAE_28990/MAE_18760-like HEPN